MKEVKLYIFISLEFILNIFLYFFVYEPCEQLLKLKTLKKNTHTKKPKDLAMWHNPFKKVSPWEEMSQSLGGSEERCRGQPAKQFFIHPDGHYSGIHNLRTTIHRNSKAHLHIHVPTRHQLAKGWHSRRATPSQHPGLSLPSTVLRQHSTHTISSHSSHCLEASCWHMPLHWTGSLPEYQELCHSQLCISHTWTAAVYFTEIKCSLECI